MAQSFRDGGTIHVFEKSSSGDWNEIDRITPSEGDTGGRFGRGFAFDGDQLLAGAQADSNEAGEEAGALYVLTLRSDQDCDLNGVLDSCDILADPLLDQNENGLLDDCECLADIGGGGGIGEGDGIVSVDDVLVLIGLWGTAGPIGDLNFDDVVGVDDLLLMLEIWGQECDA